MKAYKELKSLNDFKFDTKNWEEMKNRVFVRLFNKENLPNGILLDEVPHIDFMDLTATFSVEQKTVMNGQRGVLAYMLTNKDIEGYCIDFKTLKETAFYNLREYNGAKIETLAENAVKNNILYPLTRMPEGVPYGIDVSKGHGNPNGPMAIFQPSKNGIEDVLVISNRTNAFASTHIISNEVLERVYYKFGKENFYIVPMSVHQSLCIRNRYANKNGEYTDKEAANELSDMLENINDLMNTNANDILSYSIYYHYHDDYSTMIVN